MPEAQAIYKISNMFNEYCLCYDLQGGLAFHQHQGYHWPLLLPLYIGEKIMVKGQLTSYK